MTRNQKRLLKICISAVLLLIVFILNKCLIINKWVLLFLYLVPYGIIGYRILYKAIRGVFSGMLLDENFLMSIATIGAFALEKYTEATFVMLFYEIGEYFQSLAVNQTRKSVADLMNIRPQIAHLIDGEKDIEIELEDIKVGDILLVKPGEIVPVDGVIYKNDASFDLSALNGESMPRTICVGEKVLSGSINLSSATYILAEKVYEDSSVAKILELVENASDKKSKAEQFITKFAKIYTPIVVGLAALLAVLPPIFLGNWGDWFYRALEFLVVSCPCALVISIPLCFFASLGGASKQGILIKGSNFLEVLDKANTFVFDKTGTLTKGNFEVQEVYPQDKKEEVLKLASSCEYGSTHPIALSILRATDGLDFDKDYQVKEVFGKGIIAEKNNNKIVVGNEKLLKEYGIKYEKCSSIGTCVYVAKNNEFIGYILIADQIKDEAKNVISYLKNQNYKNIMLTGDNNLIAQTVAVKLGMDDYKGELLPISKVDEMEKILSCKNEKDVVAFVGDGINDSPVLMRADVGISMGGIGSQSSIEASDIVLMRDDLNAIIKAKHIARRAMRICRQNIFFALGVKTLVLGLSAFGLASMWLAIFADVGVAVIAILNSMRSLKTA